MQNFTELIGIAAYGVEAFGVIIIILGCMIGTVRFAMQAGTRPLEETYPKYRQMVGRSIILGLEFLIAGDVIRTVVVSHTVSSVTVLALIVVIRAFLSFTLALEVEGRVPWHRHKPETDLAANAHPSTK